MFPPEFKGSIEQAVLPSRPDSFKLLKVSGKMFFEELPQKESLRKELP
ncbi:MAG: hypothetical protein ACOYKN_02120 [Pirellula sp.]